MSTRKNSDTSRITIDMPKVKHKRLKTFAALSGKSLREMVLEFIEEGMAQQQELECPQSHTPNKETIQAIKDCLHEENLVKAKDVKDLFK